MSMDAATRADGDTFLGACIGIFISGGVVAATGRYYYFIIAGPIIAVIGNALLYTIDAHTSNPKLIGYQILAGFGCGLAFQNIVLSVQAEWHERPEYMAQVSTQFYSEESRLTAAS
jgi:hypothetical protein